MRHHRVVRGFVAATLLVAGAATAAEVTFVHQGRATDATGGVIEGSVTINLSLYATAVGDTLLWREQHTTSASNGYYSVTVGSQTDLDSSLFDGSARYLGVAIAPQLETATRVPVLSVPYAVHASSVDGNVRVGDSQDTCDESNRGAMKYDGRLSVCMASGWLSIAGGFNASGGTESIVTIDETEYRLHTYTTSGSFVVADGSATQNVEVLVVGGGGGGGSGYQAGGGGAGGMRISTYTVAGGAQIPVTVGQGGIGGSGLTSVAAQKGSSGQPSSFGPIEALGGGGGASYWNGQGQASGLAGGSGGGAGATSAVERGGAGAAGQGHAGGDSIGYGPPYAGGGGGGAGGPGALGGGSSNRGHGGIGIQTSFTGTPTYFAGGGGGGAYSTASGSGGTGGLGGGGTGGSGGAGNNGQPNTGGGGGGGGENGSQAGSGGSGIVIVRYPTE